MLPAAPLPWVLSQTTSSDVAHLGVLAAIVVGAGAGGATASGPAEGTAASAAAGMSAAAQAIAAAPVSRRGEAVGRCT